MALIENAMREQVAAAEQNRAELMKRAMLAYDDQAPKTLTVKGNVDDNVQTNYAAMIVDKGVSFLFGDELKIEVGAEAPDGQSKDTGGEDFLEGVWEEDTRGVDLIDLATNGGIFGHSWAQIVVENKRPRVVVLDPLNMSARWAGDDISNVDLYRCEYPSFDAWGRSIVKRQDTVRKGAREHSGGVAQWEIVDSWSFSDKAYWTETSRVSWIYDFAPIFHTKNLPRANVFHGRADLTLGVLRLNHYIDRADSLINRIIRLHAHPKTVAKGMEPQDLKIGSDDVLFLPELEMELENLEMESDLAASMSFRDRLRRSLAEVSHVPEITTETKSLGQLSGRAMQILYGPLIDVTKKKRRLYGRFLKAIVRALLIVGGKTEEAKRVVLHWGSMLPADEKEQVEIAIGKKQLGYSDETLIRETGGDPEKERTRREHDVTDFARGTAKGFNAGAGDDVYSSGGAQA